MRLAYSLVGVLSAIVMFAGDLYVLLMGFAGVFMDFLEWFTTSLDSGSYARGYTYGGLMLVVVAIIGLYSILEFVIGIVSYFLSKDPDHKKWIVLYSVNSALMLLASLMSIGCFIWLKTNGMLSPDSLMYAWPALGVLFWVVMTFIAVLNIFQMMKAEQIKHPS